MTEQNQKQQRPLIEYAVVKPFVDATALGLGLGGPAAFSGNFAAGFVVGSSFSLLWFWGKGNLGSNKKTAKRKDDFVIVNNASGSRKVRRFEQVASTYITRQSIWADMAGLFKRSEPAPLRSPVTPSVSRPDTLREFAFVSYDKSGNEVQILSSELWQFLSRAWLYRERGRGLSERFWGYRGRRAWPQWYPGPFFFEACLRLIVQAQRGTDVQLIVKVGHQQIALKWPAKKTYDHVITWYTERS